MPRIIEHSITLELDLPKKAAHKKMEVFYNPVMASHRNISIVLLNTRPHKNMNIADPLAGSGIRSLRFLRELKKGKINHLFVNDAKQNFIKVFKEKAKSNALSLQRITAGNEDASLFLLNRVGDKNKPLHFCGYFDYIEIDPFGSPNHFLDAAVARISRHGILAVTATDTAALTGTYLNSTKRKYWAQSLKNYLMHETGLRILIRKVQLQGVQFDKALIPVLSYSKDHYYRVYFRCEKGKQSGDRIIQQHQYLLYCPQCLNFKTSSWNAENCSCSAPAAPFLFAGPLWTGKLFDQKLVQMMARNNPYPEEQKLLNLLAGEAKMDVVGFYDLHVLAKRYKCNAPKMGEVLKKVKGVRTHFSGTGVKTEKELAFVVRAVKKGK